MRFNIDAAPSAGLRVIQDIPEGELLQIEGRNGIGKTLAIRLLQLVTGSQPYLDRPQSWGTLKSNLNAVRITAAGLQGGHELRFELDPDLWPSDPEAPGDWLGRAYLDGDKLDWALVPSILRVRRIGGDETLGESLAAQVAADAELVRQAGRHQAPRRKSWGGRVADLRLLTDIPAALDLSRLRQTLDQTTRALGRAEAELSDSQTKLAGAEQLQRLVLQQDALRSNGPRLTNEIRNLAQREEKLRRKVEELDGVAAKVLARSHQSGDLLDELQRLSRLQRNRRDRRERRQRQLADISRRAGVSTPVDLFAAQELLEELDEQRRDLINQRRTVDRAGVVLELIDAVEVPIDRGLAAQLGEEGLADLSMGRVTVSQFAEGLDARRESLEGIDRAAGDEILAEIQILERRIAAGQELPDAMRLLHTAERDLEATTNELSELLGALANDVAGDYERVSEDRARLLDELTRLVEERSQLEADLDALEREGSASELATAIAETAAAFGLERESWDRAATEEYHQTALSHHTELMTRRREAAEARIHAQQEIGRVTAAIQGATAQIMEAAQFSWIHGQGLPLPDPLGDVDAQADALKTLGRAVHRVEDLMLQTLNDQQALEQALGNLEQRLRASGTVGQMSEGPGSELGKPVERFYEAKFAKELSTDMVRSALFSGGTNIAVSLRDMTTSWTLPNGQRNTRPLEAFSSGERAFAYTRVQVERLADDAAQNRVIFLDEFGSFVAHDRFEQLKRYLRSQALDRAAEKIVVILPLRRTPTGEERQVLDASGGYLVRELD